MSKGSKRKSAKHVEREFARQFPRPKASTPVPMEKPWLTMTDKQIDTTYWSTGKWDRTQMKKEAMKGRQREHVRAVLAAEEVEEKDN